jgi:predicted nucleic acid-binding protein
MKAVLDACVLYPPVLREILLGVAEAGIYTPLWSDRILEEWLRATEKLGLMAATATEIALIKARFPRAMLRAAPHLEVRLHLPDPNDLHVLAVAIAGSADCIVTFNARDFPRHSLSAEGLDRRDPDGLLWEMYCHHPETVGAVIAKVHEKSEAMAGGAISLRALLKRAQCPRLAKAVTS